MNKRQAKCITTKPYSPSWYIHQRLGNFIEKLDQRKDVSQIVQNRMDTPKPSPLGFQDLLF